MRVKRYTLGSWWKCISAFREIRTVMGSFDSVRLAPHCAQDDRQLKLGSRCQRNKAWLKMTELRGRTNRWQRPASGGAKKVKGCTRLSGAGWKGISAFREMGTV